MLVLVCGGVVWLGKKKVATYLKAMGMIPYYHNRTRLAPELEAGATFVANLDEVSFDLLLDMTSRLRLHPSAGKITDVPA